jgi:hypothetical protein
VENEVHYLKNLKFENGTLINKLPFLQVTLYIRIYYNQWIYNNEKSGCQFYCVQWTGNDAVCHDPFSDKDVQVVCICHGSMGWTGTRYMYFGDEQTGNMGYLDCTSVDDLINIMKSLMKLEELTCPAEALKFLKR